VPNPYVERAIRLGAPYENGIGRRSVLNQDDWMCRMPKCRMPSRSIDRNLKREGLQGFIPEGYGTVDHKVPLAAKGTPGHVWSNVQAAHRICNGEDAQAVAMRPTKKTLPRSSSQVESAARSIDHPATS